MASKFAYVKSALLDAEGGRSDQKDDYGGLTKWGVSQRSYPHLDIANLTFEEACTKVYEPDYWNRYSLSLILTQDIANKVFLALINMNPETAIKCVQNALKTCGVTYITADGVLGPATVKAINSVHQGWLFEALKVKFGEFYISRVQEDDTQLKFLEGWMVRALG